MAGMQDLMQLLDPASVNSQAQQPAATTQTPLPVDPVVVPFKPRLPTMPTQAQMPAQMPPVQEPPADPEHVAGWKERIKEITSDKALMGAGLMVLAGALKRPEFGQNANTLFAEGLENGVNFYNKAREAEAAQAAQDRQVGVAEGKLALDKEQQPSQIALAEAQARGTNADTDALGRKLGQKDRELDLKDKELNLQKAIETAKLKGAGLGQKLTEADLKVLTVQALMKEEGLTEEQALLRVGKLDFKSQLDDVTEKQASAGADLEDMQNTRRAVWVNTLGQKGAAKLERTVKGLQDSGVMTQQFSPDSATPIVRFPGLPPAEEEELLNAYDTDPKQYAEKLSVLANRENTVKSLEDTLSANGTLRRDKTGKLISKDLPPAIVLKLNEVQNTDRAKYQKALEALSKQQAK